MMYRSGDIWERAKVRAVRAMCEQTASMHVPVFINELGSDAICLASDQSRTSFVSTVP